MRRILITGIASGQGQLVARALLRRSARYQLVGVDRVAWEACPREITTHVADVRKRRFEDVIRRERPEAIIHLGLVRHFRSHPAVRHEVNVSGTGRVLDFAVAHGVKQVVVVSSSYVYGALPENPYYMDESLPLNSSRTYPEMRDLAELDMLATQYLWRYPDMAVAVLRPTNVLGHRVQSAIGTYLQLPFVPTVLGFDPMMQFLHESDLAEAIVLAVEHCVRGAFNVVGAGAVPLRVAVHAVGRTAVPLPELGMRSAIGRLFRWGLYPFPPRAIDFAKYQCTLDGRRFRDATGFAAHFALAETFAAIRA